MRSARIAFVLCLLPLLSGCLVVELRGPLVDAFVSVAPLRSPDHPVATMTTSNSRKIAAEIGQQTWDAMTAFEKGLRVAGVEVPTEGLDDDVFYLVTVSSGLDHGWPGGAYKDLALISLGGRLHAILTGAQLKQPLVRVNMLTDAVYRVVKSELPYLTDAQLRKRLNELARPLVSDVDGKPGVTYADIVVWNYTLHRQLYRGNPEYLERLSWSIAKAWEEDLILEDSRNVVLRMGWKPYQPNADYGDVLLPCVTPVVIGDLCTFKTLPMVGMDNRAPLVADLMARLITSHPWMPKRFRQVVSALPEDVLLLMRSVTAVVIASSVERSYYSPVSGAIYLNPDYFWVTDEERRTLPDAPDYGADNSQGLGFVDLWRYVKNGDYAWGSPFDTDANGNRPLEEVIQQAARVLYHELAHAADSFPFAEMEAIDRKQPKLVEGVTFEDWGDYIPPDYDYETASSQLLQQYPLQADKLVGVANALFGDSEPTLAESRLSARQVGALFEPDGATDLYAYYTQYEDLAMLFEEAMMAIHFDIRRDVAFGPVPADDRDPLACSSYKVAWGMHGRIGAPQLRQRIDLVLAQLLPERDYRSELNALPAPVAMNPQRDWCENLATGGAANGNAALRTSIPRAWNPLSPPGARRR